MKRMIVTAAVLVLTAACSSTGGQRVRSASAPACPSAGGPPTSDPSSQDTAPIPSGASGQTSTADYAFGDSNSLAAMYQAVAVVNVVDRDAPHKRNDSTVSRIVRVQDVRDVRGSVPRCLTVDLPGGTADSIHTNDGRYPTVVKAGDRLLLFFATAPTGGGPTQPDLALLAVHDQVTLPFGGLETVNVDTWQPGPAAPASSSAPSSAPGPTTTTTMGR